MLNVIKCPNSMNVSLLIVPVCPNHLTHLTCVPVSPDIVPHSILAHPASIYHSFYLGNRHSFWRGSMHTRGICLYSEGENALLADCIITNHSRTPSQCNTRLESTPLESPAYLKCIWFYRLWEEIKQNDVKYTKTVIK